MKCADIIYDPSHSYFIFMQLCVERVAACAIIVSKGAITA